MKKVVFAVGMLAASVLLVFACGCAGTARISRPLSGKPLLAKIPEPEPRLTVGEKLTFVAAWKGIPVGRATATVEKITTFKEYEVYKVVVVARTNAVLSKLFRVEDTFTSYIDTDRLISRGYESIIREGRYKKDAVVDYDFQKSVATYRNLLDGSVKYAPIEKDVQDPISAAYLFRTMPVRTGDEIKIIVNLNEKNYEVIANVNERVRIDTPKLGKFEAFLIKPYVKLEGKRQKRGKSWGYLSTDEKRLCPYFAVKVLEIPWIGTVTATLEKVEYVSPAEN
jgi:hypothetical protein